MSDADLCHRWRSRPGGGRRAALRICLLFLLAGAAPARARPAAERPGVQLRIDSCLVVNQQEVRRLLAIELDAKLLESEAPPPGTARAAVTCDPAGVELRVDDAITRKSLWRTIDLLQASPSARPRLLALALAELLFTCWAELEINLQTLSAVDPAAASPDGGPPVPSAARRAASLVVRRKLPDATRAGPGLRLLLLAAGQAMFSGTGMMWGGGLRLGGEHRHHLGFFADVLAHHGTTQVPLGTLSADTLSAGAALVFHLAAGRFRLRAGGGLRGGAARLSGVPGNQQETQGGEVWGPYLGPMGLLGASGHLPRRLLVEISVEGGYTALPVGARVAGVRTIAIEGPWVGLQVGVGIFP